MSDWGDFLRLAGEFDAWKDINIIKLSDNRFYISCQVKNKSRSTVPRYLYCRTNGWDTSCGYAGFYKTRLDAELQLIKYYNDLLKHPMYRASKGMK